jgi:hypothetical protein
MTSPLVGDPIREEKTQILCRDLEEVVHSPGGVIAHFLEDVSVPPEGHRRVGVT